MKWKPDYMAERLQADNVRQEVKIMRAVTVRAVFIFLMAVGVRATAMEDADVSRLVSESLHTYNQYEKIIGEMKAATSDLDKQLKPLRAEIKWFKQPAFDDERIRGINSNITFYRNQIARLEAYIEIAKITDPNERAKLLDKYEADRKRLLAEEQEAGKPFRKRIDALKQEVKEKQKAFEEAMNKYFRWPKEAYSAIKHTDLDAQYHAAKVIYRWWDGDNKYGAFFHVDMRLKEGINAKDDKEMLDDKFPVFNLWPQGIEVQAGYCRVKFHVGVRDVQWQGKDKVQKYIRDLVDLDGLAQIDPADEDHVDELVKGSLACAKRYRIIKNEHSDAAGPLADERVKVKMLKLRLRKPPADSEQLKKDRSLIDHYKKELKSSQNRLEVGMVTDANERRAMIVKLEAEKRKLDAKKKKIAKPYDDKIRKLKWGFKDKEAALNEAMKRYCLTGGKAYPGVNEVLTKTTFYLGRVSYSWNDADGQRLCSALLELRNKPAVPEDARMLDGLYWVEHSNGNTIRVWVGRFRVYFEVNKKQWQGEEKVADALKHFIDLPALAKII